MVHGWYSAPMYAPLVDFSAGQRNRPQWPDVLTGDRETHIAPDQNLPVSIIWRKALICLRR